MNTDQINEKIQRLQFQHDRLTDYRIQSLDSDVKFISGLTKLVVLIEDEMSRLQIERSRQHAEQVEKFSSASAK